MLVLESFDISNKNDNSKKNLLYSFPWLPLQYLFFQRMFAA